MSVLDRVVPIDKRAFAMFRSHFWEIVLVSAVVFAPLSLFSALMNHQAEEWIEDSGSRAAIGVLAFVATSLAMWGYALCSGLLDKMVVGPAFGHPEVSLKTALRTLPYLRLVTLDVLTAAVIAIALTLGVVPGLVLFTFIALAPPLMVSEHRGVMSSLRRSVSLVRQAFWLTLLVVTLPVFVEHEIFAAVEVLFDLPLAALWLAHLGASVFVLAIVVLCEITLAFTLVEQERARATSDSGGEEPTRRPTLPGSRTSMGSTTCRNVHADG
ncbi:MAG: hypothetical protein ABWY77_02620 [Acidimicrobiia bacterium]